MNKKTEKKNSQWKILDEDKGKKLLVFLKDKLNCSNKQARKILEKGFCFLNNTLERFGTVVLKKNDLIILASGWKQTLKVETQKKLLIVYEDEYFLAVDKPIDFVSSDETIHRYFPKTFTLIHRLDKETSGILLIAKSEKFKILMIDLFATRKIHKEYLAILQGEIIQDSLKIESSIGKIRSYAGQTIYGVMAKGKPAITYLEVLEKTCGLTLVKLKPITGRTHQLRVHMKSISHPIIGDLLYSKKIDNITRSSRLMLHCLEIEFVHPITGEDICISSNIPEEFDLIFKKEK